MRKSNNVVSKRRTKQHLTQMTKSQTKYENKTKSTWESLI